MHTNVRLLREAIRGFIAEEDANPGPEMTDAEKAAKAAMTPKPEPEVSPMEAFAQALARKMRKKGVPESTVTAMIDATKTAT